MLSLTKGRAIATFTSGKSKGKDLFIHGEHNFNKKEPPQLDIDPKNKYKLLPKYFFNDRLLDLYDKANEIINQKLKTEVDFSDLKNTNLFPLPQKFSERIYVPAPSGSGKSTFIGMYLKQLRLK